MTDKISKTERNILIAGVGGQGVLLVSAIIAHAAIEAGFDVKTNEVHGMAQRGGSVLAQIRYGERVFSPLVWEGNVDLLISLEAGEALRYAHYLKPGGKATVSRQVILPVTVSSGAAVYPQDMEERLERVFAYLNYIDAPSIALNAGSSRASNAAALGAASPILPELNDFWQTAFLNVVPERYQELNLRAFEAGRNKSK